MDIHGNSVSVSSLYVFASPSTDPLKCYNFQQDVKPVVACRGCLVTEQPLRLLDEKLSYAYGLLISPMQAFDMYPKYICVYCRAMLHRFTKFRERCLSNQTVLDNIISGGYGITLDLIQSGIVSTTYPLQITVPEVISVNPQLSDVQETVIQNISDTLKSQQNNADSKSVQRKKQSDWEYNKLVESPVKISKLSGDCPQFRHEIDKYYVSDNFIDEFDSHPDLLNDNNTGNERNVKDVTVKVESTEQHLEDDFDSVDLKEEPETVSRLKHSGKNRPSKLKQIKELTKKVTYLRNNKNKKRNTQRSNDKTSDIFKNVTDQKDKSKTLNIHSGEKESSHTFNMENGANHSKLSLKYYKTQVKYLKSHRKKRKINKKDPFLNYEADKREKLLLDNRKVLEKEYDFKTVVLSKEQQIQQIQERKDSLKYKKARFKCELCYVGFLANETYNRHMDGHQLTEGSALCDVCNKCVRESMMTQHIESKHKFDYNCNQCPHISKCLYSAKLHHRWHKGVTYDCKICGKSFDKQTSVMGHMLLAHKDAMVSCSICDHKCNGEKGLRAHINLSHKEAKGAVCDCCGVQFHSVSALEQHRTQALDGCSQICACAACGEGFASQQLLDTHKSHSHKRTDYVCQICHRVFDDKYKYIAHIAYIKHKINKTGNNSRTENPTETGKRTKGDTKVNKHKESKMKPKNNGNETKKTGKSKRKVHMCEICGSSYTNKTYFDTHCRIHNGEKPFICDYCAKGFASKFFLSRHIQLHMGKTAGNRKVHSCQYCHRQFSFPSNKLRHELTAHRGVVQFSCHICGATFTTKAAMQGHVRHTHEGVPWPKRVRKV